MSLINRSSIIRVRNLREGLYSGAMIDSEIHVLIPSMFMAGTPGVAAHEQLEEGSYESTKLRGKNIVSFIRVSQDENVDDCDGMTEKKPWKIFSVVTVNVGGSQLTHQLWDHIATYLLWCCGRNPCNCRLFLKGSGPKELPLYIHPNSTNEFGELKFELISESLFEGPLIPIKHGLEITSQQQVGLLTGDLPFLNTQFGLTKDFRHGLHKCLWCEIETKDLKVSWDNMAVKPPTRTASSISHNYQVFEATQCSKQSVGVISEPIFKGFPIENVVVPFLHVDMGIWNKVHDTTKELLKLSADEPHLRRTDIRAAEINVKIAELDNKMRNKTAEVAVLKEELDGKKKHLHTLTAYLRNLYVTKRPRFGKMTVEMKEATKEVKATEKGIAKLESQLKKMKAEVK